MLRAAPADAFEPDELAEAVATQLLERWGVALRELDAAAHFRNRLDTEDQLIGVVARVDLPRTALVSPANDAAIQYA